MDAHRPGRGPARAAGAVPVNRRPLPWADARGSAFAEFVLALPILVGLFLAMLLLGRGIAVKTAVMAAARVAARQYAVTGNASEAAKVARQQMTDEGFDPSRVRVVVSGDQFLTVTVTYRLPLPFAGSTLPGLPHEWTIPGRAVFRRSG